MTRGEILYPRTTIRAMVPVSMRPRATPPHRANQVAAFLCDLPWVNRTRSSGCSELL